MVKEKGNGKDQGKRKASEFPNGNGKSKIYAKEAMNKKLHLVCKGHSNLEMHLRLVHAIPSEVCGEKKSSIFKQSFLSSLSLLVFWVPR